LTSLYTVLALLAFAGNNLLCRVALGRHAIDPASFTTIRMVSGAAILLAISAQRPAQRRTLRSAWVPAIVLVCYAVAFSFAYVSLTTGTGALILFGTVQTTMLVVALLSGERPVPLEWLGLASAVVGLIVLVFPGLAAPSLPGSALMVIAGIAWGLYSLLGRAVSDPLAATTQNFVGAVPLTVLAGLPMIGRMHVTPSGAVLAVSAGAITSGVGYVIWYAALRGMSATRAATVQTAVPVLAAIGGVIVLSERVTLRLVGAAVLILGGIALAMLRRRP